MQNSFEASVPHDLPWVNIRREWFLSWLLAGSIRVHLSAMWLLSRQSNPLSDCAVLFDAFHLIMSFLRYRWRLLWFNRKQSTLLLLFSHPVNINKVTCKQRSSNSSRWQFLSCPCYFLRSLAENMSFLIWGFALVNIDKVIKRERNS